MNGRAIIFCFFTLLLAGCGQPTISTTSLASYNQSRKEIERGLSAEKRKAFDDAISLEAKKSFADIFADVIANGIGNKKADNEVIKSLSKLNGKTADGVIRMAYLDLQGDLKKEEVDLTNLKKKKEKVLVLVKQAKMAKEQSDKEKAATIAARKRELAKFQVLSSTFRWVNSDFTRTADFYLKIKNGLSKAVSRLYGLVIVKKSHREVPYLETTFNYQIPGGIEPGETLSWHLSPNPFSDWGHIPNKTGALDVKVIIYGLDGVNGKRLYDLAAYFPEVKSTLEKDPLGYTPNDKLDNGAQSALDEAQKKLDDVEGAITDKEDDIEKDRKLLSELEVYAKA